MQYVPSKETLRLRTTTLDSWKLEKSDSSFAPEGIPTNADMEPVPREGWTWTTSTFAAYWFSDLINAGSWSQVSAFVSLGLTWWESMLAVVLGGTLIAVVIAFNGIIGARLHTPFAITSRAAFGYNLSNFAVISRMVIAWFWMSVNTYQGGTGIRLMITAIWPSFKNLPNTLPEGANVTSSEFLCFFLFWLLQFPFCLIHPSRLRPLFLVKAITLPIVALAMMIWSIKAAGPQASTVLQAKTTLTGLPAWFAFMTAVTSCMSTWTTLACNIGDFSRYSKKESSATLQILFVPLLWGTCSLFGAIASNCTFAIYGEVLWQPFDIIAKWEGNSGARAAAFFCALAWAVGNLTTNITANSISAANDLATLFPRWFNIRRGQILTSLMCFAFAPWQVLSSAGSFIAFMASYAVVLAPIASILVVDFFIVKRGAIHVPMLYDPQGIYRYSYGCNWRAALALVIAVAPNMPGMVNALNPSIDIGGAKYIYAVATIFGLTVSGGTYALLSKYFPDHQSTIESPILAIDIAEGRVVWERRGARGEGESLDEKEEAKDVETPLAVLE